MVRAPHYGKGCPLNACTDNPATTTGVAAIIGPPADHTALLLQIREWLKDSSGPSLILDYRVRRSVFAIETALGGIRHGS